MGNHGILVIGNTVADAFNRMFYFERAAETYIKALWTGRPLRTLSDEIAEKAASRDGQLSRPGRAAPLRIEGDPRRAGAGLPELIQRRPSSGSAPGAGPPRMAAIVGSGQAARLRSPALPARRRPFPRESPAQGSTAPSLPPAGG